MEKYDTDSNRMYKNEPSSSIQFPSVDIFFEIRYVTMAIFECTVPEI